jgi:hypothetical protein
VGSAYTDAQWWGGDDRPFLRTLFAQMHSGEFGGLGSGVLNPHRLSASGYSVGSQMVSWLMQVSPGRHQVIKGTDMHLNVLNASYCVVCIFAHVQLRWALNDNLALG